MTLLEQLSQEHVQLCIDKVKLIEQFKTVEMPERDDMLRGELLADKKIRQKYAAYFNLSNLLKQNRERREFLKTIIKI